MTTREMSESNENFEKDLTLNAEAAQEAATTAQENTPAAETEEVVDKQVENTAMAQEESCAEHQEDAQAEQVKASEAVQMPVESLAESKQEDSDVMEELPNIDYSTLDKGQLVEELEKLLQQPVEIVKDKVTAIKGAFFALRKEEIAKEKAEFVEAGNEEDAFVATELIEKKLEDSNTKEEQLEVNVATKKAENKEEIEELTIDDFINDFKL